MIPRHSLRQFRRSCPLQDEDTTGLAPVIAPEMPNADHPDVPTLVEDFKNLPR